MHDFQTIGLFLSLGLVHQYAIGLPFSTSDTTAQLMQLCQSESIGIFDHDQSRIRDIDPDFNNGRRYKDLRLSLGECLHDRIFLLGRHFSV